MKSNVFMMAIAIAISLPGIAQETETIYSTKDKERPMNTLVKGEKGFGGHLSLNVKGTEVYDETVVLVGGELVFTISHTINLGVAGYGMASRVDYDEPNTFFPTFYPLNLEMGYGGFFIEPVFFDQNLVHFTVPLLIGGGWAGISRRDNFGNGFDYDYNILDDTGFFVLEPGVNMELNISRYVKFTLGGTYRMITGSDLTGVSDSDLSGFSISGGLRVGWF